MATVTLTTKQIITLATGYKVCNFDEMYEAFAEIVGWDNVRMVLPQNRPRVLPFIRREFPWAFETAMSNPHWTYDGFEANNIAHDCIKKYGEKITVTI